MHRLSTTGHEPSSRCRRHARAPSGEDSTRACSRLPEEGDDSKREGQLSARHQASCRNAKAECVARVQDCQYVCSMSLVSRTAARRLLRGLRVPRHLVREVDANIRFVADDPGVVARWDVMCVSGADLDLASVVHQDVESARSWCRSGVPNPPCEALIDGVAVADSVGPDSDPTRHRGVFVGAFGGHPTCDRGVDVRHIDKRTPRPVWPGRSAVRLAQPRLWRS